MNLRKLKKEFGSSFPNVSRNRKLKTVTVSGAGLVYHVDERCFSGERELAEHMRSKIPVANVVLPQ